MKSLLWAIVCDIFDHRKAIAETAAKIWSRFKKK